MRILVVDDEKSFVDYLSLVLSSKGYEVVTALSPSAAKKIFSAMPIHLVLTDMVMPEVSGLDLISHLRSTDAELPAIIMSGYSLDQLNHLSSDALLTKVGFWEKSPDIKGLLGVISQYIG